MPLPLIPLLLLAGVGIALAQNSSEGTASPQSTPGDGSGEDGTAPGAEETEGEGEGDDTIETESERTANYGAFQNDYAQTEFHNLIAQSEDRYGIPRDLYARQLWQESRFNPEAVGDGGAAIGITQ